MDYGYAGKILHVDLTGGTLEVEQPTDDFYRTYVGGSALGLYYLLRTTPPDADPLGPENTLAFAVSGITGTPIAGQSRATAVAKSPLTDAVGDSQAGGFWPAELKFAGFDGIVIRGAAEEPVYLWIHDGEYELRPADHLWGKTTSEVDATLKEELDDRRVQIAQVGPAGEHLVRFAAIMNMVNRAHGRTGLGAVMGSKRLKAIAVRGSSKKIPMANPEQLRAYMKESLPPIKEDHHVRELSVLGTPFIVESQDWQGGLPTRNWQSGTMGQARAARLGGTTMWEELLRGAAEGDQMRKGRDTCYSCAVRCKRVIEAEWEDRSIRAESGGPEYETISTFGSYCDIDDLAAVSYANQLCADYGVDTISAGATMAFAIECYESGLIDATDTGGIELGWGNAPAMIEMLERTLQREGFGDVLAEGSYRAAERIGRGADQYVITSKKQELAAHMPHVKRSLGLVYAVNPFGADHVSSEHDTLYSPEYQENEGLHYGRRMAELGLTSPQDPMVLNDDKVEFALVTQYVYSAMDTLAVCQFVFGPTWALMGMGRLVEIVNAVLGWDWEIDDLLLVGARRLNMLRAFNAREGITRDRDTLPKRLFDKSLEGGLTDGVSLDREEFAAALETYYRMAGWDPITGNPPRERLEELDLGWVADELDL